MLAHCVEINRLENEADLVSRTAIARLFDQEKDPINLIKIKELARIPGNGHRQGGRCRQRAGDCGSEERLSSRHLPEHREPDW